MWLLDISATATATATAFAALSASAVLARDRISIVGSSTVFP
mgnify:CR=1 FL=1